MQDYTINPIIAVRDDGFSHLFGCDMPCTKERFGDLYAGYLKGKAHIREIGAGVGFEYTYNTEIGDIMGSHNPVDFDHYKGPKPPSWWLPKEVLEMLNKDSDDESVVDRAYKRLNELCPDSWLRWGDLRAMANIRNLIKEGTDPFSVLANRAHGEGLKVWARFELREGLPSFLADRQELFIPNTLKPDFKHIEVRKHYHSIFKEIISKGADGISLDFCVYPEFVETPEDGKYITEFLSEMRNAFPDTQIIARLPRNPERYGLFWRDWICEEVVDVIIPSMIYPGELFDLPIDEYVETAKGTKTKVFGCMRPKYTNLNPDPEKKDGKKTTKPRFNRPCTEENDRARAALLLNSGAEGLQLALGTAMSCYEDVLYGSNEYTDGYKIHYERLTDFENIRFEDKTYPLIYDGIFSATLDKERKEIAVPFRLAEDFEGAKKKGLDVCVSVCPVVRAPEEGEHLRMILNGIYTFELSEENMGGNFEEPVNYSHSEVVSAENFEFGWWNKGRKSIDVGLDCINEGENTLEFVFETNKDSKIEIIDVDIEVKYLKK